MSIQNTLWIHLFHLYLLKEPTRAAGSSGSFDVCFPNNRDTFSSTHSNDNSMPAKRWNTAPPLPLYWISIQIKVQWISPIISMNMPPTNKHTPTIIWGEKRDEKDFLMFPKKHIFCLSLGAKLFTHHDVWWWRWLFLLHLRAVEALCSYDFSATSSIHPSQC